MNIKQAIEFIAEAWENVEKQTIRNCWKKTEIVSNFNFEPIQEEQAIIQSNLDILDEISDILLTILTDEICNNFITYIRDKTSPLTEEILDDTQIINFVQEELSVEDDTDNEKELIPKVLPKEAFNTIKKVILFYEQQSINDECKMEDLKVFRRYASDLKICYITSLQQKSIEDYFFLS